MIVSYTMQWEIRYTDIRADVINYVHHLSNLIQQKLTPDWVLEETPEEVIPASGEDSLPDSWSSETQETQLDTGAIAVEISSEANTTSTSKQSHEELLLERLRYYQAHKDELWGNDD